MGDDLAAAIVTALEPVLGSGVEVTGLTALTSGASRRSWHFEAAAGGNPPAHYVIQLEMMAGTAATDGSGPLPMSVQGGVLEAALKAGVPVPPVAASGLYDGRQFIITGWLDGEALPPKMLRDPDLESGRARLMTDAARALAGIHGLDPDGLGLQPQDRLTLYRERLDLMGEPRPVLELGYRWLIDHRPDPGPLAVVHGDFRLGNLLVDRTGLTAVLDWEMVHLGDPHEDVAWATIRAWRFDRHRQPGVFPDPEHWAQAYSAAAGRDGFDADTLRWWQIAGTWFWAVISAMQARRHLDGWVQSLEHAVIGRRVCESEWDLLELLP